MSTSYNNQWLLGRSRWRRRAPVTGSGSRRQPPAPLPQEPRERQRAAAHDQNHPLPPWGGLVRKRPRWIDRDI